MLKFQSKDQMDQKTEIYSQKFTLQLEEKRLLVTTLKAETERLEHVLADKKNEH